MSENRYKSTRFFWGRLALAVLLLMAFAVCLPSGTVQAKKKKPAPYGTLRVESKPAGLPIEIDGKPYGTTTANYTTIERLDPGTHTVVITLPDGRQWRREVDVPAGRVKCLFVTYRPPVAIAGIPCPFPVNLSAPLETTDGSIVTFKADVSYAGSKDLVYTWTVSPANAKILSGAGTPKIEVDTTGLGGQRVTATVVADDGSGEAGCRQIAQAATFIPPVERRERVANQFDVCCSCATDDQKARLDNLAIELNNDPTTTAYVIVYPGRRSRAGQAIRLQTLARDYLLSKRKIAPSRIVMLTGGMGDEDCVELWLVPQGAPVPKPTH